MGHLMKLNPLKPTQKEPDGFSRLDSTIEIKDNPAQQNRKNPIPIKTVEKTIIAPTDLLNQSTFCNRETNHYQMYLVR